MKHQRYLFAKGKMSSTFNNTQSRLCEKEEMEIKVEEGKEIFNIV